MKQYVCAFRGRRDSYQVPLALAQNDLLDQLITDFYSTSIIRKTAFLLPRYLQEKISFRSEPGIPLSKIKCLWGTTGLERFRHFLGFSPVKTYALLDKSFSLAALSRAKTMRSNLLLYTPYAWEAFRARYFHNPHKVLFQFHPHTDFEVKILTEDLNHFPFFEHSYQEAAGVFLRTDLQIRVRDCWKYADLILCASNFTKQTLLAAGADSDICKVVPYGVDLPVISEEPTKDCFVALFVGSGIQRKGLHHLLYAWQRANLPKKSLLILACRILEPELKKIINKTKNVQLIKGGSASVLAQIFSKSHLFVMPSLTEGFGQVFLEALSYGCPVLGTVNTCLPDLGGEEEGVFLTETGNIDQLTYQLEHLSKLLLNNRGMRKKARACAEKFSWQKFRASFCSLL